MSYFSQHILSKIPAEKDGKEEAETGKKKVKKMLFLPCKVFFRMVY